MKEHVLVILPHPDDESYGVAGLIALNRKKDIPVTYACATLGEMGRNMGDPFFANRETLPLLRKQELINACKEMDINDLRMLGLRDKTLEFEDDEYLADIMEEIIDDVKPSLIVTFYPDTVCTLTMMHAGKRLSVRCTAKRKKTVRAQSAWPLPATEKRFSAKLMSYLISKK
nr:bacillithiol biosynthesis deacetylase BshB2 [Bacillus subtilis]